MHKQTTEISMVPKVMDANLQNRRYTIHQGGTGSGKTWSVLQWIGYYGKYSKMPLVVSVVAESYRHLQRGAMRDFRKLNQILAWGYKENKANHTFSFGHVIIEFLSASEPDKLRGPRRDILYINECNRIPYESFNQLNSRTKLRTFLDFNPTKRFWVHDELIPSLTAQGYTFTKSKYTDNAFLQSTEIDNIERMRSNANWWKVYGEGEVGEYEGRVFNNWEIIPDDVTMPGNMLGYGLDFGFVNSPTVIVQVNECNGELYVDELVYKTKVHNDQLFAFAQQNLDLDKLAVADCAETKTIDYMFRKGWKGIQGCIKGHDSVMHGLQLLLDRKINVTARSVNIIKELNNYMWDTAPDGKLTNNPVKDYDHAMDAIRYLISYPQKKRIKLL
jgi:phage terminase large subunit